jgi:branched-subunit amino acid ABC-type transport system permease component
MAAETGLLNAIVVGIVTGSIVALGAIGLALVYDIADVPNFAHGDILTFGAFAALLVNKPGTVPGFNLLTAEGEVVGLSALAVLFVVSVASVLGVVYHLGGVRALKGGWWGVDAPPAVALGVHAAVAFLVGALVVVNVQSFLGGLLFAIVLTGAVVPLMESKVFRKFRWKGASLAMMLVVSLALAFILRFSVQTVFGGEIRFYNVTSTVTVGGRTIDVARAQFVDISVAAGGLVLDIQRTGDELVRTLVFNYAWPELLGTLLVAGAVAYAGYRRRLDTAAVAGPYLAAALGGLAAVLVGGAVFAGGGPVESAIYETRVRLSPLRLAIVLIALAMMAVLHYVLRATTLGKAMRATSDNRDLAMVRGINTRRVMMTVWIIAGLFGAIAGVMLGFLFNNLTINLGFNLLLPMFAGAILGGISVYGAILGSYVVGLAMEVGIFAIPFVDTTYRIPVAFVVLLIVLLVKPEGLVGGG